MTIERWKEETMGLGELEAGIDLPELQKSKQEKETGTVAVQTGNLWPTPEFIHCPQKETWYNSTELCVIRKISQATSLNNYN